MIDMVLAQENVDSLLTEGEVLWLLGDHQGTIRDVVEYNDVAGETEHLEHYRYDSYGNLTEITEADGTTVISTDRGDALTTRQYTGRIWDNASELQYNRNRWYNPKTGRWMSEDPIGFAGGQENLLVYVGNSPVMFTDPWGLAESPSDSEKWMYIADTVEGRGLPTFLPTEMSHAGVKLAPGKNNYNSTRWWWGGWQGTVGLREYDALMYAYNEGRLYTGDVSQFFN